jgi:hypothetical protein
MDAMASMTPMGPIQLSPGEGVAGGIRGKEAKEGIEVEGVGGTEGPSPGEEVVDL